VLAPGEAGLRPEEQALLDRICEAYYLPAWCSVADYQRLMEANGLQVGRRPAGWLAGPSPPLPSAAAHSCCSCPARRSCSWWCPRRCASGLLTRTACLPAQDIKTADWSEEVAPFWGAVIQSALTGQGLSGLLKAGWTTIKGALVMPLMAQGFNMGLIKFNCITAVKPPGN
jgi:hypothetical protein